MTKNWLGNHFPEQKQFYMAQTVYYWRGSTETRQDIISSISSAGFTVVERRTLDEILDRIGRDQPIMLIVDGTAGNRESAGRVIELAGTARLFHLPILFLCLQARRRTETLAKSFSKLLPVDVPYRADVIAWAVKMMSTGGGELSQVRKRLEESSQEAALAGQKEAEQQTASPAPPAPQQQAATETTPDQPPPFDLDLPLAAVETRPLSEKSLDELHAVPAMPAAEEAAKAPSQRVTRRTVEDNAESIRKRMRANADPRKLSGSYGGEAFAIARHPEDFDDNCLVPDVPRRQRILELVRAASASEPWAAVQAKRRAFVSTAAAASLALPPGSVDSITVSALFLNWLMRRYPARIAALDLTSAKEQDLQGAAAVLKESSRFVIQEIGHQRSSETMAAAAEILLHQDPSKYGELVREAEIVLAVEIASRCCWSLEFWNPSGAYRSIRYFRAGSGVITGSAVRSSLIRILGEAVSAHITVGNVFCSLVDPDIAMWDEEIARKRAGEDEIREAVEQAKARASETFIVAIADLEPGMLLLEPVLARDGRLVLQANVLLDQDIVHSLWQLAAVRALQSKVGVAVRLAAD